MNSLPRPHPARRALAGLMAFLIGFGPLTPMALDGDWVGNLSGAEPPGRTALFTCWYSNCDNIVFPTSTATLQGADNRLIAGVAHVEMARRPEVLQGCLALLARAADSVAKI